jgi:hypothetical protein
MAREYSVTPRAIALVLSNQSYRDPSYRPLRRRPGRSRWSGHMQREFLHAISGSMAARQILVRVEGSEQALWHFLRAGLRDGLLERDGGCYRLTKRGEVLRDFLAAEEAA